MGVSEANVEPLLVDGVFGVKLTGVETKVAAIDALVGKDEMAIAAGESEVVLLEKLASGGFPIVVTADESFAFFVDGEDGATVSVMVNALFLVVDERGEVFVKEKLRVDVCREGGSGDFLDELGIMFLVNLELAAERAGIATRIEIVMSGTKILAMDGAEIVVRTRKLNHKLIIADAGEKLSREIG